MSEDRAYVAKSRPIEKWMRERGWNYTGHDGSLKERVYALFSRPRPWWDWGHRLMVLVGAHDGGNWSEPSPPTWWYRLGEPKRMARTKYPVHPPSTIQVVKSYAEMRELTEGLDEDEMYPWKAIGVSDGDLHLGHQYWGGRYYGIDKWEQNLLRRYLIEWRLKDWFGLRSWLYCQGLHAAVNQKKPFACNQIPPKGSGGYDHWYCPLPRNHNGQHAFRNYRWGCGDDVTYTGDGVNA